MEFYAYVIGFYGNSLSEHTGKFIVLAKDINKAKEYAEKYHPFSTINSLCKVSEDKFSSIEEAKKCAQKKDLL